ncbi:unnamed protein product [Litomosoides sigmodontis]|uniref:Uncharacterized protein n=1 Tax=Litomosoides sigmodontis TaxID=42156 RepID=A0A3P6UIT5_LITSI|nr:unnamed protein product [Litomosoides sigmodontis]
MCDFFVLQSPSLAHCSQHGIRLKQSLNRRLLCFRVISPRKVGGNLVCGANGCKQRNFTAGVAPVTQRPATQMPLKQESSSSKPAQVPPSLILDTQCGDTRASQKR